MMKNLLNMNFVSPVRRVQPQFAAKLKLTQPNTPESSRFKNDAVAVRTMRELIERVDEMMTVTGETYGQNEAFTGTLHIKMNKGDELSSGHNVLANLDTRVEQVDGPRMVISTKVSDYRTPGRAIANSWASFTAIDSQLLSAQNKMQTVPVTALDVSDPAVKVGSDKAADWNKALFGFYKKLATRLSAKDPNAVLADLRQATTSEARLVKTNLYVRTDMLNKKQTGHGGVAAALALQDMTRLARQYNGASGHQGPQYNLTEFTANYLSAFNVQDSLQYDTTIDYVSGNTMVLSTRISKLNTKKQEIEGPIILVNAKIEAPQGHRLLAMSPSDLEAPIRAQEAQDWLQAVTKIPA